MLTIASYGLMFLLSILLGLFNNLLASGICSAPVAIVCNPTFVVQEYHQSNLLEPACMLGATEQHVFSKRTDNRYHYGGFLSHHNFPEEALSYDE